MPTHTAHFTVLEIDTRASKPNGAFDSVLLAGVLGVLMFAVLAFGGTPEWAVAVMEAACGALFVAWAVRQVSGGALEVPANPLLAPMAGFALLIAAQLVLGLTGYRWASQQEAMRYVAYGILFLVAQHCFTRGRFRRRFVYALTFFGTAVALAAVLQDVSAGGKIYWHWPVPDSGMVYGPFANHGNYAGLMEMLAPIPLALALGTRRSPGRRMLLAFAGVFMAATIFFSRSRGGIVAFGAEAIFLLCYLWSRQRRGGLALKVGLPAVALVALVIALGPASLGDQLRSLREPLNPQTNGDRITIARDALRMFRARPVAGWGLDVFPVAYPKYRSFATPYFINEAHNDYVQLLAETGVLGFAAMLVFVVLLYRVGLRTARRGEGPIGGVSAVAALTGCTGLLAHGLSDFNLHIPANAGLFFVLCALATSSSGDRRGPNYSRGPVIDPFDVASS